MTPTLAATTTTGRIPACLLVLVTAGSFCLSGCMTASISPAASAPRSLEIGESVKILVPARASPGKQKQTGVLLKANEYYAISVPVRDLWVDWFIPCGPNGNNSFWMRLVGRHKAKTKPLPESEWMALLGSTKPDGSGAFRVGSNWSGAPAADGELVLFSNDADCFYWNNWGSVTCTIQRVN